MKFAFTFVAAYLLALAAAQTSPTPRPTAPPRVKNAGACDTDKDCKPYPSTVCVQFSQGDFVSGKCTPNYGGKPVCRGGQSGLCPQYQDPTQGYLNTQCVLVDKAQQPGSTGSSGGASGTTTTDTTDTTTSTDTTPATTKKSSATVPTTTASGPKPPQIPGGRRRLQANASSTDGATTVGDVAGAPTPVAAITPLKAQKCPSDTTLSLDDPKCWFTTTWQNKTIL
ncbi:Aste57867_7256 [Aphanomyces stellatus]|uniref:Aste57867_7256 protein n=1 Tax=Aphanomyces stellatus TaxID=120398 RepID=A0A485KI25_9STRA|nr:hypothetical protein As57867_007231 [Aphanomyces stellatus]VFT84179.1 Aste57867_7256 [Aphanomyces stellatus]